jgi:phosphoribosylformylglycinamidine synthase
MLWHGDDTTNGVDGIIVPGGFAHGDYLRTGAIARFSPIMKAVEAFAAAGGPVVGFCNGFQVLLEAGLLEGAMLRNRSLQYRCEHVHVRVERNDTPWTSLCAPGLVMRIPIAHGEGNYYADPAVIARLEANGQVIFRYTTAAGEVTDDANPNGSLHNIAGICNERRNVVALMPHPERACEPVLGSGDGKIVLDSVVASLRKGAPVAAR